jgi:hypothetical protein
MIGRNCGQSLRGAPVPSIQPFFRKRGFDNETVQVLDQAYASVCRSLFPTGQVPTTQEFVAKLIVESAKFGVRDPDRLATIALSKLSTFHRDVTARFGVIPNFFVSAPDAPEILDRLWDFAESAYLDNPIPSLFKERIFVFLSRFCPVRYCIIRHVGFLAGYGHASGDAAATPQTIAQILKLLRSPVPWRRNLEPVHRALAQFKHPIDWPAPDTEIEDGIFALAALVFVQESQAERARQILRQALGGNRLEYLLALLAFIRTAHYWTEVHPGLEIEDDVRDLMNENKELASLLLQDPELGFRYRDAVEPVN